MAGKVRKGAPGWTDAVTIVIGVVFIVWLFSPKHSDPDAFNYSDEVHARELVRAQLKDPDSAQFDSMTQGKDTKIIYGRVNAKNSFGAYIGYRTFRVHPDGRVELSQ